MKLTGDRIAENGMEAMEDTAKDTRTRIQEMINHQINPAVAGHGGFVEFVDYKDGVVSLRMGGGCQGCGMALMTLKQGIERMLREEIPEIREIVDVTDHSGGSNPYYQPPK